MKKYKIPEGMLQAVHEALMNEKPPFTQLDWERCAALACVQWLAENPLTPTERQWLDIQHDSPMASWLDRAVEWERRMFLQPDPEIPREIKGLFWQDFKGVITLDNDSEAAAHNKAVLKAYEIGRNSSK